MNNLNYPAKTLLTVYYREGCHLCEQMTASLRLLQREITFDIELVNIDLDAALRERYNVDVPVVTLDDEVICYHFFEEDMVRESINNYCGS